MIDKTLSYLDYLKLLEIIFHFSATPFSADAIRNLKPLSNKTEIMERQDCVEAVLEAVKWDGRIPLSDIPDVREIIKRASVKDSVLDAGDFILLSGFAHASDGVLSFLKGLYSKKPFVEVTLGRMTPLLELSRKIGRTVNPDGFIEDSASYELSHIRRELYQLRDRMKKQLERIMDRESIRPVLQDNYIAIRNNRYVIPLKPNFNEALQGIVHDYSHSLKTSFVEPMECVEINNDINVLVNEEQEEEKRVLKDLTDFVRGFVESLQVNMAAMGDLDFYQALALFCIEFRCVRPVIAEMGGMEIKGALNPFIMLSRKDETVPIDILMAEEKKAMIISGPNAGGKTAALKTIGLLCVMAKAGLYIPASGVPVVPLFSNIYALIGDEQDIAMELSSFTAHMTAIKDLFNHAEGKELILIDEIGGSTEPQEASALAMGVIDAFMEKGCSVIVTTHLNLIKAYGYAKPYALNAATLFDSEKMKALYRLTYGVAGYSNAINVAKNINVPATIIEKSYAYLDRQEFMLNDLVAGLEKEKKAAQEERQTLIKLKEEARKRLSLIDEKRQDYLKKVEARCAGRLAELEEEIENIKIDVAKKDKGAINKSKRRIHYLQERFGGDALHAKEEIDIGDYVLIKSLGSKGRVVDITGNKELFEVTVGNVRTTLKRYMIEKTTAETGTGKEPRPQDRFDVEAPKEGQINLIGMRVEEALATLDRFLDRALIEGLSRVRILHGVGTGRLMQAVRDHLASAPFVKSVERDERNSGITIVEFA